VPPTEVIHRLEVRAKKVVIINRLTTQRITRRCSESHQRHGPGIETAARKRSLQDALRCKWRISTNRSIWSLEKPLRNLPFLPDRLLVVPFEILYVVLLQSIPRRPQNTGAEPDTLSSLHRLPRENPRDGHQVKAREIELAAAALHEGPVEKEECLGRHPDPEVNNGVKADQERITRRVDAVQVALAKKTAIKKMTAVAAGSEAVRPVEKGTAKVEVRADLGQTSQEANLVLERRRNLRAGIEAGLTAGLERALHVPGGMIRRTARDLRLAVGNPQEDMLDVVRQTMTVRQSRTLIQSQRFELIVTDHVPLGVCTRHLRILRS